MKQKPAEKENLHPRNLHRGRYDFKQLCKSCPELEAFVSVNQYQNETIDFSNPNAVKALNKALLKHFYGIDYWDIPAGYLCPPIPGRADYLHYMADLLGDNDPGSIRQKIKVLDIGTGANCVYPIIGSSVYGWQFVGTDVDPVAVKSAKKIIALNKHLIGLIEIRQQTTPAAIFMGIIKPGEFFDLTICNPPFHTSLQAARLGTVKKWENLGIIKNTKETLNFGGQGAELWTPGGEAAFINRMIEESALMPKSCLWFSALVSKKDTLAGIYKTLKRVNALDVKTITMAQGQKTSRAVAWTFLSEAEIPKWKKIRYSNV